MHQPSSASSPARMLKTDIPGRLDALRWSRFHWLIVTALGITWILDGLEVTLAGSVAGILQSRDGLSLSDSQIGAAASAYLAGAVLGALDFGYWADRAGRRLLFFVTLGLYLTASAATAFSIGPATYMVFRFFTGAGIGGEYAAINSAIQEFMPARYRGRVDLAVNGSYWFGAALGAAGTVVLLGHAGIPPALGWRFAFGIGAVLGLGILLLRKLVPESPRWLMVHGRIEEAEVIVRGIEAHAPADNATPPCAPITLDIARHGSLLDVAHALFRLYPRRAVLGVGLMMAQAFFYNAIFFTYALILTRFFQVNPGDIGLYLLPFSIANALGGFLIGPWFDTIGRKPMIAGTYALSGLLLAGGGWLFAHGQLGAAGMTVCWSVLFFIASPAASAAYLTVGESFPLEVRALAIAIFYALGTGLGGIAGPILFGQLIGTGDRAQVFDGYLLGAALMIGAAILELAIGVRAEARSLEEVARPLAAVAPDPAP